MMTLKNMQKQRTQVVFREKGSDWKLSWMQECDLDLLYLPNIEAIVFWADDIIEYSSIFSYCQSIYIL